VYCGCKMNWGAAYWVPYAISFKYQERTSNNHCLFNLSETMVTTLWLKEPTFVFAVYKLESQTHDTHTQKKVYIKLWLQTGQKSNTVATSTRLVRPSLSSPPAVKIFPLGNRQQVQSSRSVGKSSTLFHTFLS